MRPIQKLVGGTNELSFQQFDLCHFEGAEIIKFDYCAQSADLCWGGGRSLRPFLLLLPVTQGRIIGRVISSRVRLRPKFIDDGGRRGGFSALPCC
jgi:hypothetical protein